MAAKLSGAGSENVDLATNASAADAAEFEGEAEVDGEAAPPPAPSVTAKDPMIRRKIEDKLERIRLREELGIYDEDQWKDL